MIVSGKQPPLPHARLGDELTLMTVIDGTSEAVPQDIAAPETQAPTTAPAAAEKSDKRARRAPRMLATVAPAPQPAPSIDSNEGEDDLPSDDGESQTLANLDDHDEAGSGGDQPEQAAGGKDVEAESPPTAAPRAASARSAEAEPFLHLPAEVAKALRIYDTFPALPDSMRRERVEHAVLLDVCVTERGSVSNVLTMQGSVAALDAELHSAIRTWRYRPLLVSGTPMPFCHALQVTYRLN
jgi:hypothetical protein